jgi:hypothetical protein
MFHSFERLSLSSQKVRQNKLECFPFTNQFSPV